LQPVGKEEGASSARASKNMSDGVGEKLLLPIEPAGSITIVILASRLRGDHFENATAKPACGLLNKNQFF
jgi:hypothetical protein